jgi:Dolichyl-phosphate-mannose-protein mannosyltransferase
MIARLARSLTRGLPVVLACWCAAAVVLWPFHAVPFVDDWVYAWSVENLLTNRRLEVLDFSSNVIYAQALWGALFCLPFGFSFAALRVSTWVLASVALAGVYRLLREADASEAGATLGAASLAAYPPFLMLSVSFMTDVPLVAVEAWMFVFYVRAHRHRSSRDLWIGTLLAAIAGAIRVVGLVPAAAMAAALLVDRRGWGRARGRFLVPLAAVVATGGLAWSHQHHVRHIADLSYIENTPGPRLEALREYAVALLPAWLPLSAEFMAVGLGLALAPVAVALRSTAGRRQRVVAIAAVSALVFMVGHLTGGLHYPVFGSEGTWISDELGSALTLLPGWTPLTVPVGVTVAATVLSWASFLSLASSATRPGRDGTTSAVLWWTIAGLILMAAVLWLATDRYILAFLAPALALVLGRGAPVSWPRAVPALALFAAIGVVGLRDRVSAEHAIWSAVDDLRQSGVPVADIDAGYVVNGWLQYAHPEQAHRDARGNVAVPFVNGDASLPWVISAAPLPGMQIVREYPVRRTWRTPGSVFVTRRTEAATMPHRSGDVPASGR